MSIEYELSQKVLISKNLTNSVNLDDFFLLEYCFGFLKEKNISWNVISTFEHILESFLNTKGYEILYFLYDRKDILQNLINHSYSITMSELLQRILNLTIPKEKNNNFLKYYRNK